MKNETKLYGGIQPFNSRILTKNINKNLNTFDLNNDASIKINSDCKKNNIFNKQTCSTLTDIKLLEAGDHNGSTFYQHERFARVLRGEQSVEVSMHDGLKAVLIGLAAQHSIETHKSVDLTCGEYRIS